MEYLSNNRITSIVFLQVGLHLWCQRWAVEFRENSGRWEQVQGRPRLSFDRGNKVTGPFPFSWISKYVNKRVLSRTVMSVVTRQLPRGHSRAIPERRD